MDVTDFSVALFPFLKTSSPVQIGPYRFRSTTDLEGLPEAQAKAVSDLASMLYLRDELRITEATYTIAAPLGSLRPGPVLEGLDRLRAIVGYVYSAPHPTSGDIFLPFDQASLAVLGPAPVPIRILRPEYGVFATSDDFGPTPDKRGYVPGYEGMFNLRQPLWLTPGSRLYGPRPNMNLNISQDLAAQFDALEYYPESGTAMLVKLLGGSPSPFKVRVFTALDWYNSASDDLGDVSRNLLDLAIAFETLLRLPSPEKTDRLIDAVSLLLGRTERLSDWAEQFYMARSSVAHEGRVRDGRFYAPTPAKKGDPPHSAGSIMTFGRHIFQLCLTTILTGAKLANEAGLKDRFVSNSERYARMSEALSQKSPAPRERLLGIGRDVQALSEFRFVGDGGLTVGGILATVRLACQALLECGVEMGDPLQHLLKIITRPPKKKDDFAGLEALSILAPAFEAADADTIDSAAGVTADLVKEAWGSLFMIHYAWKEARDRETDAQWEGKTDKGE